MTRIGRPSAQDRATQTRWLDRTGLLPRRHFLATPLKYLHDIGAAEGEARHQHRREAGEDANDREHPELAQKLRDEETERNSRLTGRNDVAEIKKLTAPLPEATYLARDYAAALSEAEASCCRRSLATGTPGSASRHLDPPVDLAS